MSAWGANSGHSGVRLSPKEKPGTLPGFCVCVQRKASIEPVIDSDTHDIVSDLVADRNDPESWAKHERIYRAEIDVEVFYLTSSCAC